MLLYFLFLYPSINGVNGPVILQYWVYNCGSSLQVPCIHLMGPFICSD